jgi:hypothetical protein
MAGGAGGGLDLGAVCRGAAGAFAGGQAVLVGTCRRGRAWPAATRAAKWPARLLLSVPAMHPRGCHREMVDGREQQKHRDSRADAQREHLFRQGGAEVSTVT